MMPIVFIDALQADKTKPNEKAITLKEW